MDALDVILSGLTDEQRFELEKVIVQRNSNEWLEHQQKMFQLRIWALTIVVCLAVFIVAWLLQLITGRKPDQWVLDILSTVITAIIGSASAQVAVNAITMLKSAKDVKKITKDEPKDS